MKSPSAHALGLQGKLDRCDRELERIHATTGEPAWLMTLAEQDWEHEKELINGTL